MWPHLQREKVTEWKSVRINDYVWNEDGDEENDEEKKKEMDLAGYRVIWGYKSYFNNKLVFIAMYPYVQMLYL